MVIRLTNQLRNSSTNTLIVVPHQRAQGLKELLAEAWRRVPFLVVGQYREKDTLHQLVVVQIIG